MPRVVLVGNLAQVTGGVAEFHLSATSVKQLFAQLAERHPALGPHLESGVAVAIDGQIYQDALLEPIAPDSEVFVLPQIAGGGDPCDGIARSSALAVSSAPNCRCTSATRSRGRFGEPVMGGASVPVPSRS